MTLRLAQRSHPSRRTPSQQGGRRRTDTATNMSIRVNIHRLLYATRPGSCVMATERHLRALPKDFWVTLLTYSLNVFSFNGRLERRRLRC
jgi:hypothetical protein